MNALFDRQFQSVTLPDGEVAICPQFIEEAQANNLLRQLTATLDWQQETLRIYGRQVVVPRLVAWYGSANARYTYSGVLHEPTPWTPTLATLREQISRACGHDFNAVLANRYRNGNDSMGWHADNEPELGDRPVIASLSLGATRRMRFRHRARGHASLGIDLPNGSLLLMRGDTQRHWQHCLTRTRLPVAERVNLTFRSICQ